MNGIPKAYAAAASQLLRTEKLTHSQVVCRLYRDAIRCVDSWAMNRDIFLDEVTKIRAEFDENKGLAGDSPKTIALVRAAQEKLVEHTHPDRYIPAYMPGGSLFMRASPLPMQVCYPDGTPEEFKHETLEVNPDMTVAKDGMQNASLVDAPNKKLV